LKYFLYLSLAISMLACSAKEPPQALQNLEQYHGQWLVINYWAEWCKPCAEEIPELNALDQRYSQVTVVGVNYDGASGPALKQQEEKLGVEFGTLESDPAGTLGIPRPRVLPTTLILNPDGKLATTLVGPQTLISLARITGQMPEA
jgi:thiol-disulfide isomerase/thioredoxin